MISSCLRLHRRTCPKTVNFQPHPDRKSPTGRSRCMFTNTLIFVLRLAQLSQIEGGELPGTFIIHYRSANFQTARGAERVGRKALRRTRNPTRSEVPKNKCGSPCVSRSGVPFEEKSLPY